MISVLLQLTAKSSSELFVEVMNEYLTGMFFDSHCI